MLKNELELLVKVPRRNTINDRGGSWQWSFDEHLMAGCGGVREAWAVAAFSVKSDATLRRYFDFHYKFLTDLISQQGCDDEVLVQLCTLMDHLLGYYGSFIEQQQPVALGFYKYRVQLLVIYYERFMAFLGSSGINSRLKDCLRDCLPPLYVNIPELVFLGDLFYREKLIRALCDLEAVFPAVNDEVLTGTLMSLNFNHFRFFKYLQDQTKATLENLGPELWGKYLMDISIGIGRKGTDITGCFDGRWAGICDLFRTWLYEQGQLMILGSFPPDEGANCSKIPLNISVAYLACLIRGMHDAGVYGTVSLKAIFEHASAVFTTKRQERISAESLSNAYYNISQSTAARMISIFELASVSIKQRYFPV